MKRLSLLFAIGLAACGPAATATTPAPSPSIDASSPTPAAVPSPTGTPTAAPSGSAARPTAVRFVDAEHGWLGVDDGILGTADGGATWTRELGGTAVSRIWAIDATHAWAETTGNVLYRTEDGTRWQPTPRRDGAFAELQFVSSKLGWAIVDQPAPTPVGQPIQLGGSLLQSRDGGATWKTITTRSLRSVCFLDELNGWAADAKRIFKTADGGATWSQVADLAITDDGPWYPTIRCADGMNARVQITEPYAALSHAPYLVYRTSDGGKTWTLEYREGYTLGSTTPAGTPELGSYPSIFDTLGAGTTWVVTCTPPLGSQAFFVLARDGAVIARGDVPFASCVVDASFVDAQHGWVVGPVFAAGQTKYVLVRTVDGARSWERVYPR